MQQSHSQFRKSIKVIMKYTTKHNLILQQNTEQNREQQCNPDNIKEYMKLVGTTDGEVTTDQSKTTFLKMN